MLIIPLGNALSVSPDSPNLRQPMENNNYKVYMHTSPSGKVYVGITCQPTYARWKNGNGYKNNKHFYNAIIKYGWDNFEHQIILENVSKETACAVEIELISKYRSNQFKYGYNRSTGGEFAAIGVPKSAETRSKISNSLKGRKLSEEQIRHISAALKGKSHKPMSDEHKKNLSISHMGNIPSNAKKVICLENNKIYASAHEAGRSLNVQYQKVWAVCEGRRKSTGGYHFKWA